MVGISLPNRLLRVAAVVAATVLAVAVLDATMVEAASSLRPGARQAAGTARQEQPQGVATPDPAPVDTTLPAPIGLLSPTVGLAADQEVTSTAPSVAPAANASALEETVVTGQPLQGTIIYNGTNYAARFFVEGQVYRIEPFASAGLELPRETAVLTLFACDASTSESQEGCYWDPYLLQRDGFYEVFDDSLTVGLPSLMLRDADAPPEDQVWIHNRTGITESVVFRDIVYDVGPGSVQEYDVEIGAPVIMYVRSCGSLETSEICEWAPKTLDPGAYYAMVEVSTAGLAPGSLIRAVDLRPVLDVSGEAVAAPAAIACQLRVPAINIRSGPGLQYLIVGKVRGDETGPASVSVIGRSADDRWFAVAETVADSGWVTSNPDFITCDGSANELPIAEFTGGELAPTPTPVPEPVVVQAPEPAPVAVEAPAAEPEEALPPEPVEEPAPEEEAPAAEAAEAAAPEGEAPAPAIPEGLAELAVHNGFQYPIRFTVDQSYRPIEGPSEFDLEPEASTSILVFPGTVAFTASSPWNGLSGNAVVEAAADQSMVLWLRFQQDPQDSSTWQLAWD